MIKLFADDTANVGQSFGTRLQTFKLTLKYLKKILYVNN